VAALYGEMHISVVLDSDARCGIFTEFESLNNALLAAVCERAPIFTQMTAKTSVFININPFQSNIPPLFSGVLYAEYGKLAV
jgi:hypothetical protein